MAWASSKSIPKKSLSKPEGKFCNGKKQQFGESKWENSQVNLTQINPLFTKIILFHRNHESKSYPFLKNKRDPFSQTPPTCIDPFRRRVQWRNQWVDLHSRRNLNSQSYGKTTPKVQESNQKACKNLIVSHSFMYIHVLLTYSFITIFIYYNLHSL